MADNSVISAGFGDIRNVYASTMHELHSVIVGILTHLK